MKRSNRNSSGKIVNIYSSSHVNVAMRSRSRAPVYEILSRARKGSVREKKLNCHHINEIFRMISASANSSHSFERTHIEHHIPTPLQPTNRRQSVMEQKTHTHRRNSDEKKNIVKLLRSSTSATIYHFDEVERATPPLLPPSSIYVVSVGMEC